MEFLLEIAMGHMVNMSNWSNQSVAQFGEAGQQQVDG